MRPHQPEEAGNGTDAWSMRPGQYPDERPGLSGPVVAPPDRDRWRDHRFEELDAATDRAVFGPWSGGYAA